MKVLLSGNEAIAHGAYAAGVTVAKHGNRASTSPIGSADVMEALGIPFDVEADAAVRSLREHGFAFFFAPRYHPAFRHIVPARKLCAAQGQIGPQLLQIFAANAGDFQQIINFPKQIRSGSPHHLRCQRRIET